MTRSKFLTIPAVVAGAVGLGAGAVRAAEPTTEQLMKQIEQLQAKVQQLETNQQTLATKDVDATVESVLKDADRRSQLLQMEGFTAGWQKGKGFLIQSADGNFVFNPNVQFQFRSVTNYRDEGKHGGNDSDWENGFEIRRMKFGFAGNAFTPQLQYFFLWQADRNSGTVSLDQAWVKWFFSDDWAVRLGQIVNPTFHETSTSSKYQLTADRSLAHDLITGTNEAQSQVITLVYDPKEGPITAEGGIEDGYVSNNTNFVDTNEGGTNDWGAFGRVNVFILGANAHKEYNDFSAMGNKEDLLVVGGGLDVTQSGDITVYRHTADAQYENTSGLAVYGAFLGNYIDNKQTDNSDYNWGVLAQVGYMVNEKLEVFGRYDFTKFDTDLKVGGADQWNEATVGANYFLNGHAAKFTVDLTYLCDGAPTDDTAIGVLKSTGSEWVFRGQFQLLL